MAAERRAPGVIAGRLPAIRAEGGERTRALPQAAALIDEDQLIVKLKA